MGIGEFFLDLLYYSYVKPAPAVRFGLPLLVLAAILIFFFRRRVSGRSRAQLRDLPAAEELQAALGEAAPVGAKVHFAAGSGGVVGARTAETLAGVQCFGYLARQAAAVGIPVVATTGEASALPVLDNAAMAAYDETGDSALLSAESSRFIAQDPVAYGAGVMRILNGEQVTTNVMVGSFGDEYLLMGETAARRGVTNIVAATDPYVLPFAQATGDSVLMGEEMFALSAYLQGRPSQLAGVVTQDWLRLTAVLAIVVLVLATTVGLLVL